MKRKKLTKRELERSRKRQVKKVMKNHGKEFYKEIGSLGGQSTTTKFDTSSGKLAAQIRWEKYRNQERKENVDE